MPLPTLYAACGHFRQSFLAWSGRGTGSGTGRSGLVPKRERGLGRRFARHAPPHHAAHRRRQWVCWDDHGCNRGAGVCPPGQEERGSLYL